MNKVYSFNTTQKLMTSKGMSLVDMERAGFEKFGITRKEIVKKCWQQYEARFKVEPYDYKRNLENCLYAVQHDIMLLTKKSAKHIVFKNAQFISIMNRVRLAYGGIWELNDFIISNMEQKDLTDDLVNLLLAIETFVAIQKSKSLNISDYLKAYFEARYRKHILQIAFKKDEKHKLQYLNTVSSFDSETDDYRSFIVSERARICQLRGFENGSDRFTKLAGSPQSSEKKDLIPYIDEDKSRRGVSCSNNKSNLENLNILLKNKRGDNDE